MTNTTREEMILGTIELLRENGLRGTSVRDVVERSGAPRGSIYHHFPGGKTQMVEEAVAAAGGAIAAAFDHLEADGDPAAGLSSMIDYFKGVLVASDFRAGCPIAAVAAETDPTEDHRISDSAARIFGQWHERLAKGLVDNGATATRAQTVATMAIASTEGALLMCRAERSTKPLDDVATELEFTMASALAFA